MTRIAVNSSLNRRCLNKARSFFRDIGLPSREMKSLAFPEDRHFLHGKPFMEGCYIDSGILYYCPAKVLIGSLLHEAGHLATIPKNQWYRISPGDLDDSRITSPFGIGGEFAAEAWCYAAANAIGIDTYLALMGTTNIHCHNLSPDRITEVNQKNYLCGMSQAEYLLWKKLADGDHIGIALLSVAGMVSSCANYPQISSWFWDGGDRTNLPDRTFIETLATSVGTINQDIMDLWGI